MDRFRRAPDFVIGDDQDRPYLRRWWLIPRNRWFNIYLHHFCRSDDDRALHDHPWWWCSLIISGPGYLEHTPAGVFWRKPWRLRFGRAAALHRVELLESGVRNDRGAFDIPVWTIFVTGPRIREWGFACPNGWRHWKEFCGVSPDGQNNGKTSKGCAP
ncbi:hypothetical protein [Neoasaia chiangmaiensis]|uniref:hypothetical protein n=1 Tax=Neoasaia chiangmaiensis TaxID=320497 RepID=UPI001B803BA7|nr:hypothetical protein [Neoasaia chiangmaiensis]